MLILTYKLLIATYGFILNLKALFLSKCLVDSCVCYNDLLLLLLLLYLFILPLKFLMTWQLSIESELQTQLMEHVVDRGDWTPKHPEYRPRCPTQCVYMHSVVGLQPQFDYAAQLENCNCLSIHAVRKSNYWPKRVIPRCTHLNLWFSAFEKDAV